MKRNILCIDDIETNLFTLESVLSSEKDSNYGIFTALSAHDAFDILIKEEIHLILLDVMMPEIDGFMTAKMILSNKKTRKIPIIFVTAKTDDLTISKCYDVGARDYVIKPFNSTELLNRVAFHLKLRDKERLLQQEKEYAQSIFDLQDNFLIVTDGVRVIKLNKAMLDFFALDSLFDFQNKYGCICQTFIKEEGYFHLDLVKKETLWLDNVIELLKENDVVVKIVNALGEEYTFALKVVGFHDLYIVALTDITTLSEQFKEFEHEANFDALTKIYNRNMFHRLIDKKISKAKIEKKSFVFVILDIDFFKNVNDTHGHLVGDNTLIHLSSLISNHIRDNDIFARWGGEEFVLCFDVGIERGMEIVEHLRKFIEIEQFDVIESLTCSFGVSEFRKDDTLDSTIKRADDALYEAKKSGRNVVCQG